MIRNKTKSIYSILTTTWFVIFLMASTSHMGISHHLYFPCNSSSQVNFVENNQSDNKDCLWDYATLMTSGDDTSIDFSYTIDSDHYYSVIYNQFYSSDIYTSSDPRAPPETLS